jgi:hypothetical protein
MKCFVSVGLLFALCLSGSPVISQDTSPPSQAAANSAAQAKESPKAGSAVSASDVAAAKASHKVWVNLDTGIYHKGGRWYGKTKNGKFMTVDEAKKAGYKPAKRD